MITELARQALKDFVEDNFVAYNVGTGGDSSNPNATTLDSPITSSIQTSNITIFNSGESTIDYKVEILGSGFVGHTVKEIGLYETTGNTLICRVPLDPIGPLVSTDEIEVIITLEVD